LVEFLNKITKGFALELDSLCTYCGVGCEISAEVSDNKISKIYSKSETEVSRGDLCLKGKEGFGFLSSGNRLNGAFVKKEFVKKNSDLIADLNFTDEVEIQENTFYKIPYSDGYKIVARKFKELLNRKEKSIASIGGARTSCESGFLFQKITREVFNSPHVDCCARVCHSPSLRGMRETIGEGASTNPFRDLENSEFILIIGSNTTEGHPIVANKLLKAKREGKLEIATVDIRQTQIFKNSKFGIVLPYESNLLFLNMMARVILEENLVNEKFIDTRTKYFKEYRESILNDEYANPDFFKKLSGYEHLADEVRKLARHYASKKSMILWGLGVTENFDGSKAVMAITNLALLTGNIGGSGVGLMPLRGQNNVQGACDVGMLPYYDPDYEHPKEVGMMTPDIFRAILSDEIFGIWNMGEDLAHIHSNLNMVHEALQKLEFLVVNEVMLNEVTKFADVLFGVKSGYEKTGVYVNAERRLHLSQPLVKSDLPDDWEIIQGVENEFLGNWSYTSSESVWNDVRQKVKKRYLNASYELLEEKRSEGIQWPVVEKETPILHLENFRTKDGLGRFSYHQYKLRGQVSEILKNGKSKTFYLSTGRNIIHYNNSAQTRGTERLLKLSDKDILLVSFEDREFFENRKSVKLKSSYGESSELPFKITKTLKKGTLFTTFHHPESRINFLFGDERDELIATALFKSLPVEII
jgi:formate dehydrogenase major subunit